MKTKAIKKNRWRLLHQYYKYTGFYEFLGKSVRQAIVPILGFIALLLLVHYFVIDIRTVLTEFTKSYSTPSILGVFYLSETFLGIIPPEIFIAWAERTSSPLFHLTLLALVSYSGGITAWYIGNLISRRPKVKSVIEARMGKHMKMIQKWGAMLIVAGALLPLPFAMVSMASGLINYKFRNYLLWGLFRIPRFYLYAIAIFSLV
jgi:membrane protein YqaA with SNARE-associated domain